MFNDIILNPISGPCSLLHIQQRIFFFFFGQWWVDFGLPWLLSDKESTCNAGDTGELGSIPVSGRSPKEGNGNHSSILAWKIPWKESLMGYSP